VLGDGDRERDEPDAAPDPVVAAADVRLVVRREPDLELRLEVEELLEQEPRGDRVAAGELLHERLGERLAGLGLDRGHEPRADEAREVVARALAVALEEGAEVGDGRVVAEQRAQRLQEGALPVRADAVEQEAPARWCGR
jgi:hypothetical protein